MLCVYVLCIDISITTIMPKITSNDLSFGCLCFSLARNCRRYLWMEFVISFTSFALLCALRRIMNTHHTTSRYIFRLRFANANAFKGENLSRKTIINKVLYTHTACVCDCVCVRSSVFSRGNEAKPKWWAANQPIDAHRCSCFLFIYFLVLFNSPFTDGWIFTVDVCSVIWINTFYWLGWLLLSTHNTIMVRAQYIQANSITTIVFGSSFCFVLFVFYALVFHISQSRFSAFSVFSPIRREKSENKFTNLKWFHDLKCLCVSCVLSFCLHWYFYRPFFVIVTR